MNRAPPRVPLYKVGKVNHHKHNPLLEVLPISLFCFLPLCVLRSAEAFNLSGFAKVFQYLTDHVHAHTGAFPLNAAIRNLPIVFSKHDSMDEGASGKRPIFPED